MITESIETVIVGAGQAGLSTGYHLRSAVLPGVGRDAPGGLTQRELEVLPLVAAGNRNNANTTCSSKGHPGRRRGGPLQRLGRAW
ncbi:hypothetical protein [Kribbella sp. NPDC006257]|uniref:hypothetical protein n=1 Tax=Kribbella sp. NPDC006257 TaxID=3156738 RepID=UPI0033AA2DB2